jgi:signal transduction histidine kinase
LRWFQSIAPGRRTSLIVAFAVVVLGLAVVDALVWLAVEPQLRSLREIANDHARAVQVTTAIRARIAAGRRDLLALVRGGPSTPSTPDVAAEFAILESQTDALLPLSDTSVERADLASLREALSRCTKEAAWTAALVARHDSAAALARVEPIVELTRAANEAADQIVSFNAEEVEQLSRRIRISLRWTMAAATLLTLLGGAAATLLLRRAMRGLAVEDSVASARAAELEAFASRAAHELRTPLQTVSLALSALEHGHDPRTLQKARRSAERLCDTVDGLLEFARAGAPSLAPGFADLRVIVEDLRDDLGPHMSSAGVELNVDIPEGLRVGMADTHLAAVIRNVVGNAVKYAPRSDGAHVRIIANPTLNGVRVDIVDDGPGIPPDALPHVFEPFFRASSVRPGHGLGLATVRRLVEAHHGTVHITSAVGRGTTVSLDLPRAEGGPPAH